MGFQDLVSVLTTIYELLPTGIIDFSYVMVFLGVVLIIASVAVVGIMLVYRWLSRVMELDWWGFFKTTVIIALALILLGTVLP